MPLEGESKGGKWGANKNKWRWWRREWVGQRGGTQEGKWMVEKNGLRVCRRERHMAGSTSTPN